MGRQLPQDPLLRAETGVEESPEDRVGRGGSDLEPVLGEEGKRPSRSEEARVEQAARLSGVFPRKENAPRPSLLSSPPRRPPPGGHQRGEAAAVLKPEID